MKVKSREEKIGSILKDVYEKFNELAKMGLKNDSTLKNDIWNAYVKLEYAILLAKLESKFDEPRRIDPGNFNRASNSELLALVMDCLENGKKKIKRGKVSNAIKDLRRARDAIKVLILKH
ncbi:MAG: hypothetical protein ACE5J2_04375 [Nitrososphaerales archaeon]